MPDNLTELGALAIIFIFAIKEFFGWLKSRQLQTNGNGGVLPPHPLNQAILAELRTMNSNHLHSIQEAVEKGNERLVDVIHADNVKMIEILAEIKGGLRK